MVNRLFDEIAAIMASSGMYVVPMLPITGQTWECGVKLETVDREVFWTVMHAIQEVSPEFELDEDMFPIERDGECVWATAFSDPELNEFGGITTEYGIYLYR